MVDALIRAKQTVPVQAYSFTSARIAKTLVDAHRRGAKVTVIASVGGAAVKLLTHR